MEHRLIKITTITLSRGCTINTGDFSSERIEVTMAAEIYTDNTKAAWDELVVLVERELNDIAEGIE